MQQGGSLWAFHSRVIKLLWKFITCVMFYVRISYYAIIMHWRSTWILSVTDIANPCNKKKCFYSSLTSRKSIEKKARERTCSREVGTPKWDEQQIWTKKTGKWENPECTASSLLAASQLRRASASIYEFQPSYIITQQLEERQKRLFYRRSLF